MNYNRIRTNWTTRGNRDAGSSCSCDRGLHRYLAAYLCGILKVLIHTSVTMLTSRHALERKKYHCGGDSWRGGLFTKQLKKWVKAVFLLGCYGCIFHGTGNSAQLCQNFGISGGGGLNTPHPSVRHWWPLKAVSEKYPLRLSALHVLNFTDFVVTYTLLYSPAFLYIFFPWKMSTYILSLSSDTKAG